MAPKVGPRGTTIQNVMDVATNGSKPSEPQYIYTPSTQPATTAIDYAALLAGQPAPTYGQKYGGMPTAEYFKALNIGAAQQARSVGELAAMQANANFETLQRKLVGDLIRGTNKLTPSFKSRLEGPLMTTPGTRNYRPPSFQATQDIDEQQRTLNSMYVYDMNGTRRLSMNINPLDAQALQTAINESKLELSRSGYDPAMVDRGQADAIQQTAVNKQNAYSAYMDRMNMLQSSPVSVEDEDGNQQLLYDKNGNVINRPSSAYNTQTMLFPSTPVIARNAAERQTQINLQPSYDASLAQQVTPYANLAEGIGNIPLSQLAQQMAVQRYGYDPALAQGLFDQSVDIQALTDQQTLYGLMNPDLSYTPEERIRQLYGQEELDQYNQQQAQTSLYGTPTEQTALEQQQFSELDTDLFGVYASTPAEVYAENPNVAREYMADPVFLSEFQAGVTEIAGAGQGLQTTTATQFLTDYWNASSDPVRSKIMEKLIDSAVSFMGA